MTNIIDNVNNDKETARRVMEKMTKMNVSTNIDDSDVKPITYTLDPHQVKQMNDWIEKHNKSRKCPINKRIREHRKKGVMPCGGWRQYSLEISFSSIANLATIKCQCGEELYLGEV